MKYYPEAQEAEPSLMEDFEICRAAVTEGSIEYYVRNGSTNETSSTSSSKTMRPLLIVPIVYVNSFLGALMVRSNDLTRSWRDSEVQALLTIAHQVWQAINQARLFAEKEQQSLTDSLTGCLNRRAFEVQLDSGLQTAMDINQPVSLVIIDIDRFKSINDRYGHTTGDYVLRVVGNILRGEVLGVGTAARWGGEEFALVLPGIGVEEASTMAESIRTRMEQEEIPVIDGHMTVSIGIATFPSNASSRDEMVELADEALYKAKDTGRNRICVATSTA